MERLESLGIENYMIYQDSNLYCFTSDAVLLSRFASSRKNDIVADFCSGSGIVGINHYLLTKKASKVDLYEIQENLFNLSKKTIEYNKFENVTAYNMPIQEIDNTKNDYYSLILCNPPYKKINSGEVSQKDSISICKHEITITLEEIIEIAKKKLKFGGRLCLCQRKERLIDVIYLMRKCNIEPNRLQFIKNKKDSEPYLFLIEGTKGLKPQLKILDTIVNGEE